MPLTLGNSIWFTSKFLLRPPKWPVIQRGFDAHTANYTVCAVTYMVLQNSETAEFCNLFLVSETAKRISSGFQYFMSKLWLCFVYWVNNEVTEAIIISNAKRRYNIACYFRRHFKQMCTIIFWSLWIF